MGKDKTKPKDKAKLKDKAKPTRAPAPPSPPAALPNGFCDVKRGLGVNAKICLVQYNPLYPAANILDAYNEVVESYYWGFSALGHPVSRRINDFDPDAINIVFGPQLVFDWRGRAYMESFPANTIFFNFEPIERALTGTIEHYLALNYQIWDFSLANLAVWNAFGPKYAPYYAKMAYAPVLEKAPRHLAQDIDVLYYGAITPDRIPPLLELTQWPNGLSGLSVVAMSNVWGRQRDEFIARAKVVVNFSRDNNFEIVRISYLLANRKAVVSTCPNALKIQPELHGVLRLVKNSEIFAACRELVEDDAGRALYAEQGYEAMKRCDIRDVIKGFFA